MSSYYDDPVALDLRKFPTQHIKLMTPRLNVQDNISKFWIDDSSFMEDDQGRSRCESCGQSRKYFCYTCHKLLDKFKQRTPTVKLPCRVDILKHPREVDGKSTAIHAALLAPGHVTVYTHPNIPDYRAIQDRVILIFPGPNAKKMEHMLEDWRITGPSIDEDKAGNLQLPFDRVVLIDCTWNQVKRIVLDDRVKDLQRIEISSHQTLFWRYQTGKPGTYLATIEALYYFILDLHKFIYHSHERNGELKNKDNSKLAEHVTDNDKNYLCEMEDTNKAGNLCRKTHKIVPEASSNDGKRASANNIKLSNNISVKQHNFEQSVAISKNTIVSPEPVNLKVSPISDTCCSHAGESSEVNTSDDLFVRDCCHQYDNLLFFFKFMFEKIHNIYGTENLRAYK